MPKYWGPNLWRSLNAIVRNFPKEPDDDTRQYYKTFFKTLGFILPCKKCSTHYNNYINGVKFDTVLQNRESMIKFIIDFHNNVNIRLGKKKIADNIAMSMVYDDHSNYTNEDILIIIGTNTFISILLIWLILQYV